jgi:hypothetical protein
MGDGTTSLAAVALMVMTAWIVDAATVEEADEDKVLEDAEEMLSMGEKDITLLEEMLQAE